MDFITAYAALVLGAACLFAKVGFLVWAYVRTHKLAPIFYGIYVVASVVFPVVILPQVSPSYYPLYSIASGVLEAILFVWLVRSLLKRPTRPLPNDA
ncbi:hypothetical protein [Leptolyngbya sp. BC1307]|uniref:hypothetical protein n=1 Tax=Leptolyngbya sp. BC1307 TaxID=2029589 RepID=UPI000EFAABAC|nr:hypothetical protein [Leptolyngbya sp. BC1307]